MRENRRPETFHGYGVTLTAFIVVYLFTLLVSSIGVLAWGKEVENYVSFNYTLNVFYQLFLVAATVMYARLNRYNPFEAAKIKGKISSAQIALLVPIALLCIVAFAPLANIFSTFLELMGYNSPSTSGVKNDSVGMLFLNILCVGLLPAAAEEFLFRGNVATAMRGKGYLFALITSSLIFGFFHMSAERLVHQTLLAIVICYVFFITRSYWAAFFMHLLNNIISVILDFATRNVDLGSGITSAGAGTVTAYIFILLSISLVGIVVLLIVMRIFTNVTRGVRGGQEGVVYERDESNPIIGALRDFARAFYPSGIMQNIRNMNATMKELFETPEEKEDLRREQVLDERPAEIAVTRETSRDYVLRVAKFEDSRAKRRDRNGLIAVILVLGGMWLFTIIWTWVDNAKG